ncbi:MAG: glycosyltransferase family 2 protein [bacterium]
MGSAVSLRRLFLTPVAFLSLLLFVTVLLVTLRLCTIDLSRVGLSFVVWITVFIFLALNVSRMLVCTIYAVFFPEKRTREAFLTEIPRTAIIYTLRAESCGLFERIGYTVGNNYLSNVDVWIASGDAADEFLRYEESVVDRLRQKYGHDRIRYFHVHDVAKKKKEMLDAWLKMHGAEYDYFVTCDGDSLLPKDFILRLLRKANHPDNADVAIFQSAIAIANAKTHFSHNQLVGNKIAKRLYGATLQSAFDRFIYWGHNALVRTRCFMQIRIPENVLSHDIWETVYLDKLGYRTVYCTDVVSYEEAPANYLESKKRSARWARGNLQTWRLMFTKGISAASRFYVVDGIYSYISSLVFITWVYSGIALEKTDLWIDLASTRYLTTTVMLSIVFLHKLSMCKSIRQCPALLCEIGLSTLISLNNLFYITVAVLKIPFQRKAKWIPMKKNPSETLYFRDVVSHLWPGTLLGIVSIHVAIAYAPTWGVCSIPLLMSMVLSIPVVYLTGQYRGRQRANSGASAAPLTAMVAREHGLRVSL